MIRKRYEWQVKRATLLLGERTLVAGALELDAQADPDRAFVQASHLADAGAGYLEISAAPPISGEEAPGEAEELRRLVPVLKRLKGAFDIPIAVMTMRAAVAAKAIEHGAAIIHDPSALILDPVLAKVVAEGDAGLVLSHMRGTPESWAKLGSFKDPAGAVLVELDAAVNRAIRAGVMRKRLVIDPGFDYGKRKEQNIDLLAGLDRLASLNLPLHIAPAGRSWMPASMDAQRDALALAAAVAGILRGAHVIRTTDVAATRAAAAVADELLRSEPAEKPQRAERAERPPRGPRAESAEERTEKPIRPPRQPRPAREGEPDAEDRPIREERPPREERPRREFDDRPPRRFADRPERPPRQYEDRPPRKHDDRPPRPYGDRPPSRGPRTPRPYGDRDRSDRPPRPYGDRPPRPFGDRGPRTGPPRGGKGGDRPFRPRRGPGGPPQGR